MKPIIGIIEWPYYDKEGRYIYEVPNEITNMIIKNGGIPLGIFPTQDEIFQDKKISDINKMTFKEKIELNRILNKCDGIIKPGALRIYNYERYIYSYTFERNVPYMGICAGMQLMAGYNKDINNIRNDEKVINHHSNDKYVHKLKILKNTLLYEILKEEEIMVNSRHRYHIDSSGIHSVSAISEDNIIEAIENDSRKFHIGLQWHPETLDDNNSNKIFNRFIEESKKYQKNKKIFD